ncbi:unnamed protein product [Caretta caretta]
MSLLFEQFYSALVNSLPLCSCRLFREGTVKACPAFCLCHWRRLQPAVKMENPQNTLPDPRRLALRLLCSLQNNPAIKINSKS